MPVEGLSYKYPNDKQTKLFECLENKNSYVRNSRVLVPRNLVQLVYDFIDHKVANGTDVEKKLYIDNDYNIISFIRKLLKNRPLVSVDDIWTLKTGEKVSAGSVENILSSEEMEIGSFVGLSIHTPFINSGSRENCAQCTEEERQRDGIYIGQTGACFENRFKMDWKYMIVEEEQNTAENGYGPGKQNALLNMWANFYGIDHFPLYTEAEATNNPERFHKLDENIYLDLEVYKKRVEILAEVFLKEADYRAQIEKKYSFCHIVGLGLGSWEVDEVQNEITMNVYIHLLKKFDFKHISDVYFSWFEKEVKGIPTNVGDIQIHQGRRNPAEALDDPSKILVANWFWNASSYVGNEYWNNQLDASGDAAAASCSFISYIGNPDLYELDICRV